VTASPVRARRRISAVVVPAALILLASCSTARRAELPQAVQSAPAAVAARSPSAEPVFATVKELFGNGPLFGVTMRERGAAAVEEVAGVVGCRPTLLQLFASVDNGISTGTLREVAGIPVLSIEPWRTGRGADQPEWTLAATIEGRWDEKYAAIARAVTEYRYPILIRFAHEMNGHWYPWGMANGNKRGEFTAAWRHVVDLFRNVGATNALWVWSPNVLRGADSSTLKQFWPGKAYVDVVGLTGYGERERSPTQTYRATLKLVYALTDQPILLTEVGVQAGPDKRAWLKAFGPWLHDNPRIVGFVWNQVTRDGDWRYDDTPANLSAFRSGLSSAGPRC
jgi:Glycosyl hydrolase family 26